MVEVKQRSSSKGTHMKTINKNKNSGGWDTKALYSSESPESCQFSSERSVPVADDLFLE